MVRSIVLFLGGVVLFFQNIDAQRATSDSLERYIAKATVDEEKIIPLAALCLYYHSYGDIPKAIKYAKEATRLAQLQDDYKYGVYAYASLAAIYAEMDKLIKQLIHANGILIILQI